ncbi:efflux RND transporter periplasmic adaptor subunit [Pararhizobium antarcticum]|uniref:Efflux transporter periplasmic adaptor subunit n=1 Tax=Pararhizobium antarcticum TaxID=1798805 RepID=A0A657LWY0_9HYPH|nr:efflux RND transporter periplasmic adaptor subunit [Pararhizobium antarcticum]OJF89776.1 efflux transporter periplasmic adaptor subunit [Rhizobium sp. 58]OJF99725.1 efflux transporter periplasmic adaptor subunit [Pararhizobium antarcticum]
MRRLMMLALIGFSLAACAPEEQPPQKETRRVEAVIVKPALVSDTISTTGEISARVQSDLSFRVSGRLVERRVDIGDRVTVGQVLARIDAEEQKADLQVALANLNSAEALETQARQGFDRQQSLFTTGVTTRAALDNSRESLLTTQASVQSAQAQLDAARDALGQTDLKADASGIITARSAEVGQVAQAAQSMFTLAHDGPRDAVINADESALLGRQLESVAEVKLLSGDGTFKATVREVSPTIDTTTGTIRVKLGLEDAPDAPLGSAVTVTARYKPQTVIELPWSAMASDAGRPAVWLIDSKTGAVSLRRVVVAAYSTQRFSVESGVSEGDIVVSNGTKFLSAGDLVSHEGAAQ